MCIIIRFCEGIRVKDLCEVIEEIRKVLESTMLKTFNEIGLDEKIVERYSRIEVSNIEYSLYINNSIDEDLECEDLIALIKFSDIDAITMLNQVFAFVKSVDKIGMVIDNIKEFLINVVRNYRNVIKYATIVQGETLEPDTMIGVVVRDLNDAASMLLNTTARLAFLLDASYLFSLILEHNTILKSYIVDKLKIIANEIDDVHVSISDVVVFWLAKKENLVDLITKNAVKGYSKSPFVKIAIKIIKDVINDILTSGKTR